ncbi:MAG: reductase [Pseudomonadota bacterium]
MTKTVAIIGARQIGFAVWLAFKGAGHNCLVYARSEPGWLGDWKGEFRPYTAGEDPGPSADVVIDSIAFDEEDITRYDPDKVGRLIVISSASVYCDDQGRTLDEGPVNGYPHFPPFITEDQPTVAPGPETYSTRKVRMENKAIELFGDRATILRPCAIYGEWSRHPREWWFVKRILDGRTLVPLIYDGLSQFQTTDACWLSDVAVAAAEQELAQIFNVADKTTPTVSEIGHAIAAHMNAPLELRQIAGAGEGFVGRTPWSLPHPMQIDGSRAAEAIGQPRPHYASRVEHAVQWLCDLNPDDWRTAFPLLAAYPWDLFDYEAEDRFLASQ